MSGPRLRETFNRLLKTQFVSYLKKGAAGLVIASALAMPAQAHHNDNNDLNVRDSETVHSRDLHRLQDKFNNAVKDRRLILIDRDWIEINRAINDVRGDENLRNRYLAEYLVRYGKLHISQDFFKDLQDSDIYSSPHTNVFTVFPQNGPPLKVCTVFGGRGEMDGRTAVRDFINPSAVVHGQLVAGAKILLDPDAAEYQKFVTYHEIGHCMDDYFLPKMSGAADHDEMLAYYHRAETFADVYSALIMARDEGVTNIAETIADIRLANMALSGPYQVAWGNPLGSGYNASYIYATYRPVRAAQAWIDKNGAQSLQNMTYRQVADLAHTIVDKNALNRLEADALMYLFSSKFDLTVWDKVKANVPYVAKRYNYAVQLKKDMEQGLRAVLDLRAIPANQSALSRITFAGTPYQRAAETKAAVDQNAMKARAKAISDDMVAAAGGKGATVERLIDVFSARKDQWRATLSSGTDAEKQEALKDLKVAEYALWLASETIKGPAPAPANNNAPAPQTIQAKGHAGTGGPAPA